MITIDKTVQYVDNQARIICTYYGLRTDSKPTDAANGSAFVEMDTSKVYFYDASEGGRGWIEWGASS